MSQKTSSTLQVVRIQCPALGTKRIDTKGNESIAEFLKKVCLS